jgi:hypothetical protein
MDPTTLFGGDRMGVERAIDRHGLKSVNPRLATAAAALRARYWFWAVADHLEEVSASKTVVQGLDAVNGFEFGLAMNRDLEMVAQLHMRSAEDAARMLTTMALLETMAKSQAGAASQIKLESRVTDRTVDVSLRVPEEELKQAWEKQRAQIAQRVSQLPDQITAARTGKPFHPSAAAPAQKPAPTQAHAPVSPASRQSKIVSDEDGNTVQLTLPGK